MHPEYTLVADVEVACIICGTIVRTFPSLARRKKYCSVSCKNLGNALRARPEADRFWEKVDTSGGEDACWLWTASLDGKGYGQFTRRDRSQARSHRIAWEFTHGPLTSDQVLCHTCDNPRCCNPAHLFIGTQADNIADMHKKKRWSPTPSPGSRNGNARYTEDQVREIRRLRAEGMSRAEIAARFGVTVGSIKNILSKARWKHVE